MTSMPVNTLSLGSLSLDESQYSNSSPDQIIPLLRSSLQTLLDHLKKLPSSNVTRSITLLNNNDRSLDSASSPSNRVTLNKEATELDESIVGLLNYIGSQFSVWIFDDFVNSNKLQTTLWSSFHYFTIKHYQQAVLGKSNVDASEPHFQHTRYIENERFISICQTITHYYKSFISKMIEHYGYTSQIHYVVSCLRLKPDQQNQHSSVKQKILPVLHLSIHDALCRMGDLSRYRASLEDQLTKISSDYSQALIYYTTASKISPSSGVPLNQLGNINYFRGDIFTSTYYFLRSVAVDEPFKDVSNLRLILRKLSKVKDGEFSEMPIYGLSEQGFDTIEKFHQIKRVLFQITQHYSNLYLAQYSSKGDTAKASSTGFFESSGLKARQDELAEEFYNCCKRGEIPGRILVNLVIVSIIFMWLLKKGIDERVGKGTKSKASLLSSRLAYQNALSFSLKLYSQLFSVALMQTTTRLADERLPEEFMLLLPVFRIIFDWVHKQLVDDSITDWRLDMTECNAMFLKLWQLVGYLRGKYGFEFDVLTAVARSNWDRFDEVLKQQTYDVCRESGASLDENKVFDRAVNTPGAATPKMTTNPTTSNIVKNTTSSKAMVENYEETHSFGLIPLNGGLSDTPTGLEFSNGQVTGDANKYRSECILFSAVEMSRLPVSFLKLDELLGNEAKFEFEGIEFEIVEDEEDEESEECFKTELKEEMLTCMTRISEKEGKLGGRGMPSDTLVGGPGFFGGGQVKMQRYVHGAAGEYERGPYETGRYEGGQDEEVVDERDYYNIGRNDKEIMKEGGYLKGEERKMLIGGDAGENSNRGFNAGYSELFGKRMMNPAAGGTKGVGEKYNGVNAMNSASPAFLSKLYDLEKAQFSKRGGHNTKPRNGGTESKKNEGEGGTKNRRRRRTRRRKKGGKSRCEGSGEEGSDDSCSEDEEVVFTGRGR